MHSLLFHSFDRHLSICVPLTLMVSYNCCAVGLERLPHSSRGIRLEPAAGGGHMVWPDVQQPDLIGCCRVGMHHVSRVPGSGGRISWLLLIIIHFSICCCEMYPYLCTIFLSNVLEKLKKQKQNVQGTQYYARYVSRYAIRVKVRNIISSEDPSDFQLSSVCARPPDPV